MNDISSISKISQLNQDKTTQKKSDVDFASVLDNSLKELNKVQENADKAIADLATGEVKDLHQAAIAIGKAETSMKLMLEIRNKALSAYKEISRTQI
ncbi:flagellar hook-basal body complex protein FliE [Campylobacter pinnipediorum]|uniref:Flagellar hook-basal body complex protein FliE n=1 Tax=Campylobacter pinnipediorum subsp. pinnipediorum TaxID=1660067 RepID=A0AAX0LBH0_9BACT|nr:flagellar hook-basal body complex protein FliE [Campylobacter pinnipediorum]AQW80963.1 flagellar proximal rod protein [Campylobacter pinnipediorum subsp. pinnipediorum]AQW82578.1 flagellar proximal rod protein [Campylobacter pinnipediorum subsp. pinnipediorum]AQW84263.1 flagellar proximal rod protein [Campylobacter pinnipediorum subsp. pinnipediorum]AQW85888.1 flagellar proximal rod protein [Campylobacter pinnipediorum subsp. caledonicus]OPA77073.1 flagellar hook-basal body complex protein 